MLIVKRSKAYISLISRGDPTFDAGLSLMLLEMRTLLPWRVCPFRRAGMMAFFSLERCVICLHKWIGSDSFNMLKRAEIRCKFHWLLKKLSSRGIFHLAGKTYLALHGYRIRW